MELLDLLKSRYSVREFKRDKISDDLVNKIIEAGYVAPTACNKQPIKITVVESQEGLEKLKKCTDCHFNAPLAFIISADIKKCWVRPFDKKQSGDVDASIVTTHMMLEAYSLGIGSTWVMFFKKDEVIKEFDLSSDFEPIAILPCGYPSKTAIPSKNHSTFKKLEDIVERK